MPIVRKIVATLEHFYTYCGHKDTMWAELDIGPFFLTQPNPIHKVDWKSWPNPIQNSWY